MTSKLSNAREGVVSAVAPGLLAALLALLIGVPLAGAAPGDAPEVTTPNAVEIKVLSAVFIAEVNPNGLETTYSFEYQQPGDAEWTKVPEAGESIGDGTEPQTVAQQASGLEAETEYLVRLVATNATGTTTSAETTFETLPELPPSVTDPIVTNTTLTGAGFSGEVNANGLETTYSFEYQQPGDAEWVKVPEAGESIGDSTESQGVAQQASGLESDTGYVVRLVATNGAGTTTSGETTFETEPELPPDVTTPTVSEITATTARFEGAVHPHGPATLYRFEYQQPGDVDWTLAGDGEVDGFAEVDLGALAEGLEPASEYLVRLVATNEFGSATSDEVSFETLAPAAPVAVTAAASGVTQTAATLNGTVDPEGLAVSDCHFEWGTDETYGNTAPCDSTPSGTDPVPVGASLTGLSPDTEYHFRLVATTVGGTDEGTDQEFTTDAAALAPAVTTGMASAVGQTAATLNGQVDPNGTVTTCEFDWGTTTAYGGGTVPCASAPGSGDSPVAVGATLSGLQPSTTYHYRLVAQNVGGTTNGTNATFTTATPPSTPPTTPPKTPPSTPPVTPPAKSAAGLVVAKKVRQRGRRLTISGRTARGATKRVKVVVTCAKTKLSKLAKPSSSGAWKVTLKLRGRCARARRAQLVVSYPGDAKLRKATAKRKLKLKLSRTGAPR